VLVGRLRFRLARPVLLQARELPGSAERSICLPVLLVRLLLELRLLVGHSFSLLAWRLPVLQQPLLLLLVARLRSLPVLGRLQLQGRLVLVVLLHSSVLGLVLSMVPGLLLLVERSQCSRVRRLPE
jgi:hypothetical protein